jgi:hypothetical protein
VNVIVMLSRLLFRQGRLAATSSVVSGNPDKDKSVGKDDEKRRSLQCDVSVYCIATS